MKILVRFGELMLKGKNQRMFVNKLISHLKIKFNDLDVKVINRRTQALLEFDEFNLNEVEKRLMEVPGIFTYSVIYEVDKDDEIILNKSIELLNSIVGENTKHTFKVETKRTDKNYPKTSLEYSMYIAPKILNKMNDKLIVDVRNPEITLN